jgi:hypothetical protein
MEMRDSQCLKAPSPISNSCDGLSKVTEDNLLQNAKHEEPILWSDDGSRIEDNLIHIAKHEFPITTSREPDINPTEIKALRLRKQAAPIRSTDAGIIIDLN